jgi:hypothetical protein
MGEVGFPSSNKDAVAPELEDKHVQEERRIKRMVYAK